MFTKIGSAAADFQEAGSSGVRANLSTAREPCWFGAKICEHCQFGFLQKSDPPRNPTSLSEQKRDRAFDLKIETPPLAVSTIALLHS